MSTDLIGMKVKKQEFMLRKFKGDPPHDGKTPLQTITWGDNQDTVNTVFSPEGQILSQEIVPDGFPMKKEDIARSFQ